MVRKGALYVFFLYFVSVTFIKCSKTRDPRERGRMVVGFTTTCVISAYHH
jgi:hypothetical protein